MSADKDRSLRICALLPSWIAVSENACNFLIEASSRPEASDSVASLEDFCAKWRERRKASFSIQALDELRVRLHTVPKSVTNAKSLGHRREQTARFLT